MWDLKQLLRLLPAFFEVEGTIILNLLFLGSNHDTLWNDFTALLGNVVRRTCGAPLTLLTYPTLPARAMTAGSWHLTGRAQTLAMALARHCTIPFVPLSAWESPAFKFKPNEKFFPSLFHYLLALISLRTGAEEPGEPEAESTSTSCGLYLVSRLQHNEFVLCATLNPVPMQNWLHVEKSLAKRETRAKFCITNSWEEIHIFWTQQWLKKSKHLAVARWK
ncbi:hypothetical protein B0H13DRAFT_2559541 [Mycena leptocephala]|nr:hypothetical protein B0H13DRAFT_2291913 [Mycena leptocephala]KAJ7867841.1 hypothetical protein B0H13DRAFT_2559541 [Mycena leptocephala]